MQWVLDEQGALYLFCSTKNWVPYPHRLAVALVHEGALGNDSLLRRLDCPVGGQAHEAHEDGNQAAAGKEEEGVLGVAAAGGLQGSHGVLQFGATELAIVVVVKLGGNVARGLGEVGELDAWLAGFGRRESHVAVCGGSLIRVDTAGCWRLFIGLVAQLRRAGSKARRQHGDAITLRLQWVIGTIAWHIIGSTSITAPDGDAVGATLATWGILSADTAGFALPMAVPPAAASAAVGCCIFTLYSDYLHSVC